MLVTMRKPLWGGTALPSHWLMSEQERPLTAPDAPVLSQSDQWADPLVTGTFCDQ